jgi:hypothetical protein
MSTAAVNSALKRCREAAIRTAWAQWSVLGGHVGGRFTKPAAVVDPEALVLLSCALRDDEGRLWDMVGGFAELGCGVLSVQRTRNVAAAFPSETRSELAEFAAIAVALGKDARWRPLAAKAHRPFRQGKLTNPTRNAADPAALIPRLRLAFGVHARTDALAFLIASAPVAATSREVAEATAYGEMPVRRGLSAIANARLLIADGERPERYHAERSRWAPLLQYTDAFPPWRHWHTLFAFLAAAVPSARSLTGSGTDYVISSRLRRLVLDHSAAFVRNRIPVPTPADYRAEDFLGGFVDTLEAVASWLESNT